MSFNKVTSPVFFYDAIYPKGRATMAAPIVKVRGVRGGRQVSNTILFLVFYRVPEQMQDGW